MVNEDWKHHLQTILGDLKAEPDDHSHWAALYKHLWPFVYAHNYRRLPRDVSLAEDITQEAFLALVRQFGPRARQETLHTFNEFKSAQELCNYLLVISRNALIDYLRKDSRTIRLSGDFIDSVAGTGASPEESTRLKESLQWILADLSTDDRELAKLLIAGHQPKEIIALSQHKWSPNAVYTRLSRLRDKLARSLGGPTRKKT